LKYWQYGRRNSPFKIIYRESGIFIAKIVVMMKTRRKYILFIIAALITLTTGVDIAALNGPAYAAEPVVVADPLNSMDANETALFTLINAARQNPLETAVSLGLDREQVLNDLPDLKDMLEKGLPPLVFNDRLYQAAGDHTREMLANSYYSYESLDGRTVDQRLQDAGYAPVKSSESLGLIVFKNFINADRAVYQLFEKMFKDELSPAWTGPRNILNPELSEIGIGIAGGLYQSDALKGNVYLSTCDFGKSIEIYELQLVQLINQFRAQPANVAASLGLDVEAITGVFPELKPVFLNGLPPVQFNVPLYLSAGEKINDMLENDYFGYASPGGITLGQRIWAAGYRAEWAAETLARTATCDIAMSPGLTVSRIFKQMCFNSLRTSGYRDANLLSEKAVDAGFRMVAAESAAMGNICGDHVHVTVGDFGAGLIKAEPVVNGMVFVDENGNDLYDIGEEVSGVPVTIRAQGVNGASRTVVTNPAGGYGVSVAPGLYRVSIGEAEGLQFKWIRVEAANVWQVFKVVADPVGGAGQ